MRCSGKNEGMDRRSFLKLAALGTAAVTGAAYAGEAPAAAEGAAAAKPDLVYRTLGRTGLKITPVSFGAMQTSEVAVFQAGFDMGINYVDTARGYMGGKNERIVGEALKGYRDKVYLATKVKPGSKESMMKSIDESLAALKQDYIDVLQVHAVQSKDHVMNAVYREVLADAKKQGKTRFVGVTTHSAEAEVINALVDDPDKFYDMVLVTYNFKKGPEVKEAIARAAKADIGVVAMKTQAGGYATKEMGDVSPHQAALKWVLQDANVAAAIPAMVDMQQLKEDFAVMNMKLARTDLDVLERYGVAIAPYYCQRCNACDPTCPRRVDIATVNRSLMYAEGYGDMALARAAYGEIAVGAGVDACVDCAMCTARCPNGINIAERIQTARTLFA